MRWPSRVLEEVIALRRSVIPAAWLLVSIRFLVAQEPIPVATGQPLCKTILNTSDCAHAIEARQIPLSHGRARRDRLGLHLRLKNARTQTVANDPPPAPPTAFSSLVSSSSPV